MVEFPSIRPRRLRLTPAVRAMVSETSVAPAQLVLPVFIREGLTQPAPIASVGPPPRAGFRST